MSEIANIDLFESSDGFLHAAHLRGSGIVVTFESERSRWAAPAAKPTPAKVKDEHINRSGVVFWGENNDFPQRITTLYEKSTLIPTTLGKMAARLTEGEVYPVELLDIQNGKEIVRLIKDPEIDDFLQNSDFRVRYRNETALDLVKFFNCFPEVILSKDRKKILQLLPNETSYCRWAPMNKQGRCEHIIQNANWPNATADEPESEKIPVINPYDYDAIDQVRQGNDYKYILPIFYPTWGKSFYQLAHHNSIVTSGWLDVHLAVPEFKKYVMKNQMAIKYHWKVAIEYWERAYGDRWKKANLTQRNAIKLEWLQGMEKTLTDVTKAGNSILTDREWDQVKGIWKDYIEVVVVSDGMKDGKYLNDNQEASAHILYALGVDPATLGFVSSDGGMKSGGSDKREGWLIDKTQLRPFVDFMLEPLWFVARYNGWKNRFPNLRFRTFNTLLTTLDTGAGTTQAFA